MTGSGGTSPCASYLNRLSKFRTFFSYAAAERFLDGVFRCWPIVSLGNHLGKRFDHWKREEANGGPTNVDVNAIHIQPNTPVRVTLDAFERVINVRSRHVSLPTSTATP